MAEAVSGGQQRGEVRGDAEKRRMSERRQPAISDQQIEAQRKDRRDQDLASEIDVKIAGEEREGRQQHGKNRERQSAHAPARPNSPCGRKAMTTIIGRNRMM